MKKIVLILLFGGITWAAYPQIKIMPLGNSITQAYEGRFSYRYRLWELLIAAGFSVDFVGSQNTHFDNSPLDGGGTSPYPNSSFDRDHEGHWGWRADEILNGGPGWDHPSAGKLSSWLVNYTPDLVLMHIGSNDAIQNQSTESTVADLEQIIDVLRADNSNVVIFLAKLLPLNDAVVNPRINALNAEVPGIISRKSTSNSPIILVDQNTGFDPTMGVDTYDNVHPNLAGEEKMAQKWFAAISNYYTPLPIELLNFNATVIEGKVNLSWTTASELNNDFFSVQHSTDGTSFSEFVRIPGAGNSSTQLRYSAIHHQPFWGKNYYRLKQTDFDGHFSYSKVVSVDHRDHTSAGPSIYPNPATDHLVIDFSNEEGDDRLIQLFDSNGRECFEHLAQGEIVISIPLNGFASGLYRILITSRKDKPTSRLIAIYQQ